MLAVKQCAGLPVQFDIEYRPYRLMTHIPEDAPLDKKEWYAAKFGNNQEGRAKATREWAAKLGLTINFGGVIPSTLRAHRLSIKAYRLGGQTSQLALLTSLFKAFCTDNKNIGDFDVLGDVAEEAGVMKKEDAIAFLKTDELTAEVEKMANDAKSHGVKGVPVAVIDGKWAVSGGQKSECYVQIFKKLAESAPDPATAEIPLPAAGKTCSASCS